MIVLNLSKVTIVSAVLWLIIAPVIKAQNIKEEEYDGIIKQEGRLDEEKTPSRKKIDPLAVLGIFVPIIGKVICSFFCKDDPPPPQDTQDSLAPQVTCPSIDSVIYIPEGKETTTVTWSKATAKDVAQSGASVSGVDVVKLEYPTEAEQQGVSYVLQDAEEGRYTVTFSARDNNGNTEYCSTTFRVKVRTCSYPQSSSTLSVTCPNIPPIFGNSCSFECPKGYELSGDSSRKCLDSGQFDGTPATCSEITCGVPTIPENTAFTMAIDCTDSDLYNSVCIFSCKSGYSNANGQNYDSVKCLSTGRWSSVSSTFSCIDASPPEIHECPESFTVYVDADQWAYINYTSPYAEDSTDGRITTTMVQGIAPMTSVKYDKVTPSNNLYNLEYTAVDSDGHQADNTCFFTITVSELQCPLIQNKDKLLIDCTSYTYGGNCSFSCIRDYPLIGPSVVHCEKDDLTTPPSAYWNWGQWPNETYCGVAECPALPAPDNGAMACSPLSNGKYCQMSCQEGYDIPAAKDGINGEYVCDDLAGWVPPVPDVPNCAWRIYPGKAYLPSELHYFSGDCTNATVQEQIKRNAIEKLYNGTTSWRSQCVNFVLCTIENVEVTCGARTTGKKKRATYTHTAILKFDIAIPISPEGKDINVFNSQVEEDLFNATSQLEKDVKDGKLDLPNLETDKTSFAYGSVEKQCDEGMNFSLSTYSCVGCPTGDMYELSSKECVKCPVGFYQDEAYQTTCKQCPDKHSTKFNGSRNATDCISMCTPGHYSVDGVETCQACPSNTYQEEYGQTDCVNCPPGTNSSAQGSNSLLSCTSDADACAGVDCNGHGVCYPTLNSYKCACTNGYSGVNCTVPPDPCIGNLCQNGFDCSPSGTIYTCLCNSSYTGKYCELKKVDGGWSSWGDYTTCSTSCGSGVRTRSRLCNTPYPANGGNNCTGLDTETASCPNLEDCPSCSQFSRRPYGVDSVEYTGGFDAMNATLTCFEGRVLQPSEPSRFGCSEGTGHIWNPEVNYKNLPICVEIDVPTSLTLDSTISYSTTDNVANAIGDESKANVESVLSTSTCVQSDECRTRVAADVSQQRRKKRSTTYTVLTVVTVWINFDFPSFFVNGVLQQATVNQTVQQYIAYLSDLESLAASLNNASQTGGFSVTVSGQTYTPTAGGFTINGVVGCSSGMASTGGICVNCIPGYYELNSVCVACPIGSYQPSEGQTSCISCPAGYTTTYTGELESAACISSNISQAAENEAGQLITILASLGSILVVFFGKKF